jgi:hypothetical protein
MSERRIDVIATPLFPGEEISLGIECFEPGVIWRRDERCVSAKLTTEEARYLRDELSGAIEKHAEATA